LQAAEAASLAAQADGPNREGLIYVRSQMPRDTIAIDEGRQWLHAWMGRSEANALLEENSGPGDGWFFVFPVVFPGR
jgi:hypothetical protein